MFVLTSDMRFYLYQGVADMRKSIDALSGVVRTLMLREPGSGEVFVFINRKGDMIKLLHWEHGGFVLYFKRLEAGTIQRPKTPAGDNTIDWTTLVMMVQGIGLQNVTLRKRFEWNRAGKTG
jgi:transposase